MSITTPRLDLMSRLLDVAAMRHDVIAQNVANINTPGYTTLEVNFEDALRESLANKQDASAAKAEVVEGTGGLPREDGNNVDVDMEMARLQKNSLYFKVYTQIMANELAQYRSAITGR